MLKIVKTSIIVACVAALNIGYAQANIGETFENTCTIVKADSKGELGKKLKYVKPDFKLKLKENYTNISCSNDKSSARSTTLNSAALYNRF